MCSARDVRFVTHPSLQAQVANLDEVLIAVAPLFTDTENVDKIAAQGVNFNHAYSSTPMCTPARTALLTGRSPWGHGMRG